MALSDVSNIIWQERRLLELLVFKLEEEQLVLASGRTRWLAHATREVEAVLDEIRSIELERAMALQETTAELGLGDAPSLRELSEAAPPPWDHIFGEHRRALLEVAQEIDGVSKANRELLTRSHQAAREALSAVGDVEVETYTPRGSHAERSLALRLVDEAI
jgi:hypothetical protein